MKSIKIRNAVSVNPVKVAPGLGAAFAVQGFRKSVPFFHSAPGCSFLSKVLLTQHFMEPIAVSGSDIKETALVFGGTNELEAAIKKFSVKSKPELIFVLSSSVPEIRGEVFDSFDDKFPLLESKIIIVSTPDFQGGFSEGFSKLVYATLDKLAKGGEKITNQVNILPSPYMTAGDIDEIRYIVELFGLKPLFIPDMSSGADGSKEKFSSMSVDGTSLEDISFSGRSIATFTFGKIMKSSGDLLEEKFGVRHINADSLYGLGKTDEFISHLMELSIGTELALGKLRKERARLKDMMIDTHLILNKKNIATALEYDHAAAFEHLFEEIGIKNNYAFSPVLPKDPFEDLKIAEGTLYDIEEGIGASRESGEVLDLIISNTHGKELSDKFGIPLLRAGFPVTDVYGYNFGINVGYKGAIEIISSLANSIRGHK